MWKRYPQSDQNGLQKGPQKRPQIAKMWSRSPPKIRSLKKHQKLIPKVTQKVTFLKAPTCLNHSKYWCFRTFHVLCRVAQTASNQAQKRVPKYIGPKWTPNRWKCHPEAVSKKHQKMMSKMSPNWPPNGVPKWSQNRQKWCLGVTSAQGWLPSGPQTSSEIDFRQVLGRF